MDGNALSKIRAKAETALASPAAFASFASDMEFFADQNRGVFDTQASVDRYNTEWTDLEVVNACVLEKWEEQGFDKGFLSTWSLKYEAEVSDAIKSLIGIVECEFASCMTSCH